MIDWPIGLSTGCFFETSIFECLERIRNAGFGTIEICSFPKHLDYHDAAALRKAREWIAHLGLEPYSLHAPFSEEIDITSPDEIRRRHALDEVKKATDAAALLGVRYLVIHPGPEKGGFPNEERLRRMDNAANVLTALEWYCREKGIRLVLENMLGHLFTGPVRELLWILGSMPATEIGVCLDTGHAHLAGDLHGIVHKVSAHLAMVHASDNHGKRDDHLPPGKGKIDWEKLLQQLARLGFRGTLILEISGGKSPQEVLADAQQARMFLRTIIRRLS